MIYQFYLMILMKKLIKKCWYNQKIFANKKDIDKKLKDYISENNKSIEYYNKVLELDNGYIEANRLTFT